MFAGFSRTPLGRIAPSLGKGLLSLAILSMVLRRMDTRVALQFINRMHWTHILPAIAILTAASLLPAIRWRLVLRHGGVPLSPGVVIRLALIGAFFNQVLPTGIGGDVLRAWYATRHGIDKGRAAASVLSDRILGLIALILQAFICLPYLVWVHRNPALTSIALGTSTVLACGLGGFLLLDRFIPGPIAAPAGPGSWMERGFFRPLWHLGSLGADVRGMLFHFPDNALLLGCSVLNQLMVASVYHMLFKACGVHLSPWTTLLLFPYISLVATLPVSFAGWGIREGAVVAFYSLAHVPREASLGVSILFGITMLASTFVGGLLWMKGGHRIVRPPMPEDPSEREVL